MSRQPPDDEARAVKARYARRPAADSRYSLFDPTALQALQERQRAVLRRLARQGLTDLPALRLLDVGCGTGGNLLDCLRMGFLPEHLAGIELLAERLKVARACLPASVDLRRGDATALDLPAAGFDIVTQFTVFSSLLDGAFQQRLADAMWAWVRPGGGILWYDFTVNNPRNADVRGVPLSSVRELFPQGRISAERLTLAPPIARVVNRIHPLLGSMLGCISPLRTHVLCWIGKD